MKQILIGAIFFSLLISCSQPVTEKGPLEGTWERIGTIVYKKGAPSDTLKIQDGFFQTKLFTKSRTIWLSNGVNIDTLTGEDTNTGNGGYLRNYTVKDGTLTEYLSMGSDNIENWMKSSYKADENGNYPVSFKVDIKDNTYSQMWGLDSLGNGNAEYYKRVE